MEETERAQHLKTLAETPARLKAALKGVSKKLGAARPAPGKWSILEIVCHMRDMEAEAYLARYRRILAEDNPSLPDIDGDAIAIERDYRAQSLPAALREWSKLRKESLKLLKKVKGGSGSASAPTRRRGASRSPTSCVVRPWATTRRTWARSRPPCAALRFSPGSPLVPARWPRP